MRVSNEQLPAVPELEIGTYEHYKGKKYQVISLALHTETLEYLVVYKPLYETKIPVWVRPYDMFVENVEVDGVVMPRFKKID